MEVPTSTTSVTLNIPNNKIVGQAMDVFEQYKPIVEEALQEARNKILFDDEFQEYIKGYVQRTIEKTIKEEVEKIASNVISNAFAHQYYNIEDAIKKHVNEQIKLMTEE